MIPPAIFLWTLALHLTFLVGSTDRLSPDSLLFSGEGPEIVRQASQLASSVDLSKAWGLQTSLTVWLLVPVCRLFASSDLFHLACKLLMAISNGLFFSLLYIPLREHLPRLAAPICFLLPFSFSEMLLSSSINSDVVYRLLLLIIVTLGWRWPLLAGALHALAVATHMEHLAFVLLLGAALALMLPAKRKNLAMTGLTMGFLLGACFVMGSRSQPPPPEIIAEGSISPKLEGPNAIEPPTTSLASRISSSLGSASYGWTWRDFPKMATWVRNPGDLAYSKTRWYEIACLTLVLLGIWKLRKDREFLTLAAVLVCYRLVMVGFGTPSLRSMMICSPMLVVFLLVGATAMLGRFANRGLTSCIVILALMHLPGAWRPRRYLELESTVASTKAPTDRPITLVYQGRYRLE